MTNINSSAPRHGALNLLDGLLQNASIPTAAKARLRTIRLHLEALIEREQKPAAAQEAAPPHGWLIAVDNKTPLFAPATHPDIAEAWRGIDGATVTEVFTAPVAAAPVEGGQITGWRNVDGIAVFTVASHSGITPSQEFVRYDDHLAALASTPAAPGIDLAGLQLLIQELEAEAKDSVTSDNVLCQKSAAIKNRIIERLRALLDASPQGVK